MSEINIKRLPAPPSTTPETNQQPQQLAVWFVLVGFNNKHLYSVIAWSCSGKLPEFTS
ncbi:uncharacterized protein ASCRUDRAFT_82572 [Ascoidea rubescens DSM 1968]|uniref:Uncharacterized protein n=1 Tax=Ascoidea rubescens DSM 1968 TaxID=1344418 RepID=A0A1D2VAL1_9ASCO|nr:hypothetical protein ASCRUDRAFT_82572 [Ascoidea rubescens DSM 1968]ODV58650.1 hypothetical protein ASCRUDRAFT_82572 [Ascoidea rubescens DSM 1968]